METYPLANTTITLHHLLLERLIQRAFSLDSHLHGAAVARAMVDDAILDFGLGFEPVKGSWLVWGSDAFAVESVL